MRKYLLTIIPTIIMLLTSCESELSNPNESGLFIKLLGNPQDNSIGKIIESTQNAFIIVGGIVGRSPTQDRTTLIEVDEEGNTNWQKDFINGTVGVSIKKAPDEGYTILASQIESNNLNSNDFLLIRTNNLGDTLWTKRYGDENLNEQPVSIDVIENEGYILMGNIEFTEDDSEIWVLKTDFEGNVIFDKRYGFISQKNEINNIIIAPNGDIISCGTLTQSDGSTDIRIVLADERGNLRWDRVIQLPEDQSGEDIDLLGNGFVITGITNHETNGGEDIFLARISNLGELEWTSTIGTPLNDGAFSIYSANDGLVVLGYSENASSEEQDTDIILVKTDFRGNELWNKIFGGNGDDFGMSVIQTNQNDLALLSRVRFENNDMMGFIKVDEKGELTK